MIIKLKWKTIGVLPYMHIELCRNVKFHFREFFKSWGKRSEDPGIATSNWHTYSLHTCAASLQIWGVTPRVTPTGLEAARVNTPAPAEKSQNVQDVPPPPIFPKLKNQKKSYTFLNYNQNQTFFDIQQLHR